MGKHTANSIFDLIRIDIWVPTRHLNIIGARLFLIIVDDFSKGTWPFYAK